MIINDLDGYYIVFDTKNWNTELDTLLTWCEQDVAGITSRRICYCVVTRRLLRRDASDATSWRNFGNIGKRSRLPGACKRLHIYTLPFIVKVLTFAP